MPFSLLNRLLPKKEIPEVIDMVYRHCRQKETVLFEPETPEAVEARRREVL